jgi:amino acid permease
LYLTAKDVIKAKPKSIFEIGYILFGKWMIYFNGLMMMLLGLGLDIIYYIVAGKII